MTGAEKLRQEGRVEGRQEGRVEGRHEGMLEGARRAKRELLSRLMTTRFGAVPAAVLLRLEAASEQELDVWAERVLTAATAEDVVGA